MWSFASHAGTGLAVAGLSATYFALARKNAQLERESNRMNGKEEDWNYLEKRSFSSMTMSQMLLKEEINSLSRGSGSTLGLNILENTEQIKSVPSSHSLPCIVSRVQDHLSSTTIVNQELKENADFSLQRQEDKFKGERQSSSESGSRGDSSCHSVFAVEEYSVIKMSGDALDPNVDEKSLSACKIDVDELTSKEPFETEKIKSPVVYYKNPDFGKRSACRQSIKLSDSYISPGFDIKDENYDFDIAMQSEDKDYKDSTRFLFPPVLSESKLSVCDEDQQLLFKDDFADNKELIAKIEGSSMEKNDDHVETGISQMEEIRDYNLQLQIKHELRESEFPETDTDPMIDITLKRKCKDYYNDILNFFNNDLSGEMGDNEESVKLRQRHTMTPLGGSGDYQDGSIESKEPNEDESYPKICSTSSSSIIGRIPDSSWIGWPARLYADFGPQLAEHPKAVLVFLGLFLMLIMVLGKIFIAMGDWFEFINDIEHNSEASLEH